MRRLYVQVYLAFLGVGFLSLIVSGCVAGLFWDGPDAGPIDAVSIAARIATLHASDPELQALLDAAATDLDADLTVWSHDGAVLASAGRDLPFGEQGWFRRLGRAGLRIDLPDGRVLGAAHSPHRGTSGLVWLAALMGAVAIGSYPVARRVTRRLEAVQRGVRAWGAGDLSVRVPVRGRDEVADVARTFNDAAEQVERLFEAQRRVLASASHELRSPLTRLRMAVELLSDGVIDDPSWAEGAIRDIEELDATVGDLLQVGRMQALDHPEHVEPVHLLALLREEGAHVGAVVDGPDTVVDGDPRLLRRVARNLLENARRHGAPPIEARTLPDGFEVLDRGPGVPEEDRDRIFEPFYRPKGHAEGRDGGVGLGLHLVREIARHHGGDVACEPRDGGGTAFRIRLGRQA